MGRLVKVIGGEVVVANTRVAAPGYTIFVANYAGGATPPDGWAYFEDDVEQTDFAPMWVQPTGASNAYALEAIVLHQGTRWRSLIAGNVWEPGVSNWRAADDDVPLWIQPLGATDAYAKEAIVRFSGDLWRSLLDANVWQPGVTGWRKFALIAPDGTVTIPNWVQPLGAGDAYPLNARVRHNGLIWVSTVAANVWEPGVFGWTAE